MQTRHRGFTLLEVVIALGLMGMLVGMIFRVAQTSVQLSQIVVEEQNVTMERNAFFQFTEDIILSRFLAMQSSVWRVVTPEVEMFPVNYSP